MTARERFIETWAAHCGASKAVFVGQLEQMLQAECSAACLRLLRSLNARAEADMLAGNPIEGAHYRAIEAAMKEARIGAEAKETG